MKITSNLDLYNHNLKKNQIITKFLFTSDNKGNLKQWDIEQQKLIKDFGRMHKEVIISITKTYIHLFEL